jgi:hypothetical protein
MSIHVQEAHLTRKCDLTRRCVVTQTQTYQGTKGSKASYLRNDRWSEGTDVAEEISYADLAYVPVFISKVTSFFSLTPPNTLWILIKKTMQKLEVDFVVIPQKQPKTDPLFGQGRINREYGSRIKSTKIKAIFHAPLENSDGESCVFNIEFFKQKKSGQILVEFQRSSGGRDTFYLIYCQLLSKLKDHLVNKRIPKPLQDKKFLSAITLDANTSNCILGMANSKYVDVSREGLKALAKFSHSQKNQIFLLNSASELVLLLQKTLRLETIDYVSQRYAVLIIANMSSQKNFKSYLCELSGVLVKVLLHEEEDQKTVQKLYLMDTKRKITQSLINIGQTHLAKLITMPDKIKDAIKRYDARDNERLQKLVNNLVELLAN